MGHAQPLAADLERGPEDVVEAALSLADRLGDVADVDERVLVELRPVVEHHEDVGAGARLDGGGDARLQVVGVDGLELDLGAERLAGLRHLALQLDVGLGNEVDPAHDVQLGALREGGRAARGEDSLDAAGERRGGPAVLMNARRFTLAEHGLSGRGFMIGSSLTR